MRSVPAQKCAIRASYKEEVPVACFLSDSSSLLSDLLMGDYFAFLLGFLWSSLVNTFLSHILPPNQAEMFRISPRRPDLLFSLLTLPYAPG